MRRAVASLFGLALAGVAACQGSPGDAALPTRTCNVIVWHQPVERDGGRGGRRRLERLGASGAADECVGRSRLARDVDPAQPRASTSTRSSRTDSGSLDPTVPTTGFYEDQEVTWVDVPDCSTPGLTVDTAAGSADGRATIEATFLASTSRAPLDPSTLTVTATDGSLVAPSSLTTNPAAGTIALAFAGLSSGKHTLSLHANDTNGRSADPAWSTLWIEPQPFDPRDMVLYQVMVDRYRGPGGAALAQPSIPSARAGGTVSGVTAAIASGELAALGVNALWLSPLYANPDGFFPGTDGRPYSSYHGYWPIDPRAIEPTLAPEADIDALIATAHAHDMRVLFDVVPNHVHEQHPYAQAHLDDGWFNHPDGTCICGIDLRLGDPHHRLLVRRLPPRPRLAKRRRRRPGHERRPLVDRPLRRRRHPHRRGPDDVARRDAPDRRPRSAPSTTTPPTRSSSSARTSSARTTSISSSTSSAPSASTASSTSRSCGRSAARSPTRRSR